MTEVSSPSYLTPEELRALDASYRSIATFEEWRGDVKVLGDSWDYSVVGFNQARDTFQGQSTHDIVRAAMRAAAVNTGAIEGLHEIDRGLTITVMEEAASWQTAVSVKLGSRAAALAKAALEGYKMALDLATGRQQLSEPLIRQIHAVICEPQKTYQEVTPKGWQDRRLVLGAYKLDANHVRLDDGSVHPYSPVDRTPDEMHRLIEQLSSDAFMSAHPALQAAYVHHALTVIHPFPDGNGRVARVLASVFTLKSASVPLVFFQDQKPLYLATLELADGGHPQSLVDFVVDRVVDILELLIESMRGSKQGASPFLEHLAELFADQGGLAHTDIDAVAMRLLGTLGQRLFTVVSQYSLPPGVTAQKIATGPPSGENPPEGTTWPAVASAVTDGFALFARAPASVQVQLMAEVAIRKDRSDRHPFVVRFHKAVQPGAREITEELRIRLDEVYPQESSIFQLRTEALAKRLVIESLESLARSTEEAMRQARM